VSARLTRAEVWLVFALVVALTLGVGLRGRLMDRRVNWDGLAAVAHANDVFRAGPNANLAMIGFVQPPLPALLQLPVVLVAPWLATSGLAANLLGALSAGVATVLLLGLAAECGLSRRARWPLVAVFALHPLVLGPAACGAPVALLTALLMGAAWGLLRWSRTQALRDLIASSLVLSAALITRYETAFIVVGALIYLAWGILRNGGSWSRLEGTMITFGLPIVYVGGIWVAANWAIMGDPWHFVRESFAAAPATSGEMLSATIRVGLVAFFPILALVYNQMGGAGHHAGPARPVALLVLMAMVAPAVFPRVYAGLAESDWSRLVSVLAMVLAGGFAMLAAAAGELSAGRPHRAPPHGSVLIVAASLLVVIWLGAQGRALPGPWPQAYLGRGPLADDARHELTAASLLREAGLPEQRRHLVVGWPGFAVALFAGRSGDVAVIRTSELADEIGSLWAGSRLVILAGAEAGAVPESAFDANLGLPAPLALQEQWRSGPWRCYEVVRTH